MEPLFFLIRLELALKRKQFRIFVAALSKSSYKSQLSVLGEQLAQKSPTGDTRVAEILRETSVLIQALQRNFLVRGNVSQVREEEQKKLSQPGTRIPASGPGR